MKIKLYTLFIFLLIGVNSLWASNIKPVHWSLLPYSQNIISDTNSIYIPLTRVGNLLIIEAQIDTLIGNFILDLGAPYLVLNVTYFRDYRIDDNYYSGTLLSTSNNVKRTKIKTLNLQGINYSNLRADVTDLGNIENVRGIKILGLLGVELFKNYIMDIDVLNNQLILHEKSKVLSIDSKLILETAIQFKNNVIIMEAKLKGEKLKLALDTGTERNILDNKLPSKVYNDMKIIRTSTVNDGNGGRTEVILGAIDSVFIADIKLKKMRTLILNLNSMSRAYGKKIDGMLGYPFLSIGRVVIDFKRRKLSIYRYKKRN